MDDRELLMRYRDEDLPAAEMGGVRQRLRNDVELRSTLERLELVTAALEASAAASFAPFFAARVVARIRRSGSAARVDEMHEALRWMFARVAVACLVLVVGIGVYSAAIGGGYGGSMLDAMLGLPEATLETALTLGG